MRAEGSWIDEALAEAYADVATFWCDSPTLAKRVLQLIELIHEFHVEAAIRGASTNDERWEREADIRRTHRNWMHEALRSMICRELPRLELITNDHNQREAEAEQGKEGE